MKFDSLPNSCTKSKIVRQGEEYEKIGGDGKFTIPLPFATNVEYIFNNPEATAKQILEGMGISVLGLAKQMDQVQKENIGNLLNSKIKFAISKSQPLPDQSVADAIVTSYDFSGSRVSSDESGMTEEERAVRAEIKKILRALLSGGAFLSPEGARQEMKVQTVSEAKENKLPDGKVSLNTFLSMVEAAYNGDAFVIPEINESEQYTTADEPIYNDNGLPTNLAAFIETARETALAGLERSKAMAAAISASTSS
jgi:hypothetical protein